ncbi:MAG: hypothetical protein K0Q79_2176 [Flavipsychrobacter sp.]|jgi:Gpi18-like mannosyltransferase|nr:hypothetical protein [Flavipsychrobacter sp.]
MNRYLNIFVPLVLFLFLTAMLPALRGMDFDVGVFREWALYIHQNGLRNAYGKVVYMPVYQYCIWLYVKVMGTDQAIAERIYYLRCITLVFDFIGIWYVYKWVNKRFAYFIILAICILNIGYTYDTLIWGQVDSILSALVFITIYYAYKGNNLLSSIFLVVAFSFKVQAIVIVPVWGLMFLNNIKKGELLKTLVYPVLGAVAVQILIVVPFLLGNYGLKEILAVITNSFQVYPSISVKASNIWHWIVRDKFLLYANDAEIWIFGLTYKQAGLILFFTSSFFALLPMMALLYKGWKTGGNFLRTNRELVWLTSALVYLLFYFFNTEIHERYCQPAFIFITAYAFYTDRFLAYVLFSIMYFLTLEISIEHFHLPNYGTLIFDFRFLSSLTAIIIVYLGVRLYKYYKIALAPAAATG